MAQSGAAVLAAVTLPGVWKRTTAAQEATPAIATPTRPEASPEPDRGATRVRFTVGDAEIIVRIADNPTSRDFVSMLPLTLEFDDFNAMEKISYLPRELTTEGSTGRAPANGDLIYFVPWGTSASSTTPRVGTPPMTTGSSRSVRSRPATSSSTSSRPGPCVSNASRDNHMNPTYDFTDQVALVTGAGSGMGLSTAQAFAEAGAAVVLADINEAALRAATDGLTAVGHRALGVTCDVSDEDQVAAMVERAVATFGRLDMAFNNAGIQAPPSDAADEPADVFDRVNAINLRGVWACMKHELRQMRAQGSGAIVNCSSLGGLVGLPSRAAYHASKHGVIGLTKSAALEYAPRGIRINAICPGTIETPMVAAMIAKGQLNVPEAVANQPIGRLGRAEEIAAAVLWLCSPGASFVLGVALPVDGGYTAR
jgi:NAD(P)-dependent dehydrogenase (short-subunit alcohol dehydrogenase family)